MKLPMLVSAVLLSVLCSEVFSVPMGLNTPTFCCFTYAKRMIPRSHVTDYFITSSMCSKPAVIFISRKGHKVCADPNLTWVQDHIKHLQPS